MSNVNVYKQRPDKARAESPLYHAGLDELARKSQIVANNTKQHFEVFLLTAFIYLGLTAVSMIGQQILERRANRGVRRA